MPETIKEYREFVENFEQFTTQIKFFSVPPQEPFFSWRRCECCGSSLGGHRFYGKGYVDGELDLFVVCSDCQYYSAIGRLDDATMLEIFGDDAFFNNTWRELLAEQEEKDNV